MINNKLEWMLDSKDLKKIYVIWIWWIWISAIARYYNQNWYKVYWSDKTDSELIQTLKKEWINIIIWERPDFINNDFEKIIYTEAIPENQSELQKARELKIDTLTYPEIVAEITNEKQLITIAWTHWKSTTTSLTSLILKNSLKNFTSIVWTLLKEFDNKNFFHRKENKKDYEYFVLEACEYKRSFLKYKPTFWIITNVEIDHLDYYKDLNDYISAYKDYLDNIKSWGYAIINWDDKNCKKLLNLRDDINYIEVFENYYIYNGQEKYYPKIDIKIPWKHILFDAKISFIIWKIIWINEAEILKTLSVYNWVWRRMEVIWQTVNNNILMSDYWHHPTEISLTLGSIKKANIDKKILTIFQPHQYSRTLELLEDFKNCFWNTDKLIIPDIYESRDKKEDMQKINSKKLIELINHRNKTDGNWFENTLKLINDFDKQNPNNSIIILMWAGNVDDLRYNIKTQL